MTKSDTNTLDLFDDADFAGSDTTPADGNDVEIPPILAEHRTLGLLIRSEVKRSRSHASYVRGLATVEKDTDVKQALLDFAQQLSVREWA